MDELNFYFEKGIEAYRNRKFGEAVKLFQEAISQNVSNASCHMYLANTYWYLSDFDNAALFFSKAAVLDVQNPWPLFYLGQILLILGKSEEALDVLNKCHSLEHEFGDGFMENNSLWDLFLLRASIFEEKKDYGKAIEEYNSFSLYSGNKSLSEREINRLRKLFG